MSACMQTTRAASQRVHNKFCYYSLSIIYVAHIWALLSHTCCSYIDSILITDEGRCRDKLNPKRDTVRLSSSRCLAVRSNKSCKWFLITAIKGKQVSKLTSSPKPAVIRLSSSRCEESMWPQAVRFVSDEADAQMKWIAKKSKQADVRLFSSRFEAANGKKQAMQTMGSKGYLPSKGLRARNQKKNVNPKQAAVRLSSFLSEKSGVKIINFQKQEEAPVRLSSSRYEVATGNKPCIWLFNSVVFWCTEDASNK